MKIQCSYCGNYIDDTQAVCPYCGAPNEGVVRTSSRQPLTIDQLAAWYQDRGLPPYEVTRFFIGIDYKGPRAFGIYKEPSGRCVVYKNKADGTRAVRYAGTDEAYAVNELFMRLKQEILEQKARQVKKGRPASGERSSGRQTQPTPAAPSDYPADYPKKEKVYENYSQADLMKAAAAAPPPQKAAAKEVHRYSSSKARKPKRSLLSWIFWFLLGGPFDFIISFNPLLMFVGLVWLLISFCLSAAVILLPAFMIMDPAQGGYYSYEKKTYYCIAQPDWLFRRDWLVYDKKADVWSEKPLSTEELPSVLQKKRTADDYFLGEEWSKRFKASDILSSDYYYTLTHDSQTVEKGYYAYDDVYYYHYGTDPYDGWYTYEDDVDDWTYVEAEILPEDLTKPTAERDFYFTPTWDPSTQFTDFLDSDAASEAAVTYSSTDSSSASESGSSSSWWDNDDDDDDYDWSSGWDDDDDDWDYDWDDSSSDWDDDW